MKAAAALYLEEEARVVADKQDKMSKFRESTADAAARVIQKMYYVFNVSGLKLSLLLGYPKTMTRRCYHLCDLQRIGLDLPSFSHGWLRSACFPAGLLKVN